MEEGKVGDHTGLGKANSAATRVRSKVQPRWRRAIDAAFCNRYDPRSELGTKGLLV